ncbi:ABC transporter permease [Galbitalea soli]|uniref:ABC transporter permease n=1 Tax=Galbitalea soli TaxID=1268042 RepID=A0A7C9PPG9_9MICO|nr:ABC transporter permease [Galbitalea soli]NEM92353.1 ABC transporter permease [Galbitalea soli]NYJ31690.1 ribose transport system permease protein [Galbitalea soli]
MATVTPSGTRTEPINRRALASVVLSWPGTRALIAVVVLFAVSPLFSLGSVGPTAIVSMLPFAALIAVVAIGQTLVIQQGGLDLSVAGAVTLGAVFAAKLGSDPNIGPVPAVLIAILVTSLFGIISGLVVALLDLPPLVVTIASNALMIGVVQAVSGGFSSQAPSQLTTFALSRWIGLPVLAFIALAVVLVSQSVLKLTRLGRRFELVGENRRAAEYIGVSPKVYIVSAYWLSALLAAAAGVLLAGLLRIPTLTAGDAYLLPSIAAVVLGGTALTGGRGSVVGTALGALFLAQLSQLVQTFTQSTAVQNIVQALIIGVGIVAQLQLGGSTARLTGLVTKRKPHPSTSKRSVN